jgi:integrase
MSSLRFPKKDERLDHAELAKDPRVKPWLDAIALKSKNSREVALRRLGLFLWETKLTPESIVTLANEDPDDFRDLLIAYAVEAQRKEYLGTYIRKIFVTVHSYLRFRHSPFDDFPAVETIEGESIKDERTPTPDELRELLAATSSLRGKTFALALAHLGLRPATAVGLTLEAFRELDLTGAAPRFVRLPSLVLVPARLSKTRRAYPTFASSEFAETLSLYLRERIGKGEKLSKDSPLLASTGQGRGEACKVGSFLKPAGQLVTTKALTSVLRSDIRKVRPGGQTFRPYVLRAFCSTQLLISESRGAIVRDARELFLGHNTGVAGRYNVGKKLGVEVIEELRAMYSRAEEYLSTSPKANLRASQNIMRGALLALHVKPETIDQAGELTEAVFAKLTADALKEARGADAAVPAPTPGAKQVPVPNDEVPAWLEAGWYAHLALGADRTIMSPTP